MSALAGQLAGGRTKEGHDDAEGLTSTNLDGQDSKVSGTNANADTVTVTRIDPRTLQVVSKQAGTDPKGQNVNNVAVFERQ